jgi:hypothetical protein
MGHWVSQKRRGKKAMDAGVGATNGMPPERAAALKAVPGWAWAPVAAAWQERLAELKAHVRERGRLPLRGDTEGLGDWIHRQRQGQTAMDEGKGAAARSGMTPERAAALEALPGWAWGASRKRAADEVLK